MSYSRTVNNRINKIHEKALRFVNEDEANLSFDDLLKKDEVRNDLGPEIMIDTFHFVQKPYILRNDSTLQRRRNLTVYFGIESISSFAPND